MLREESPSLFWWPMYAMVTPSGDQRGEAAVPGPRVRRFGRRRVPTGSTQTSRFTSSKRVGDRSETNASLSPLGDHAGSASSQSPSVSCCGSPPSTPMTNRWLRRSSNQPMPS